MKLSKQYILSLIIFSIFVLNLFAQKSKFISQQCNHVTIAHDTTTTNTLLVMRGRRGIGYSRRSFNRTRSHYRANRRAGIARSRPSRVSRHRRSMNRPHRGHRSWRRHWSYRYWGPGPWWGWGYAFPFGCYYYPGWGWWYYPPYACGYYWSWRCWYFDRWGYWYYPELSFGAYIASRQNRIIFIDNDSDDDLYYAVYYRQRTGDIYYLSRIDKPSLIEGERAVKIHLPKSNDADYMVIADKNEENLPTDIQQDKSGKVVVSKTKKTNSLIEKYKQSHKPIISEELSNKDKRELKKMKNKLSKKNKKLRQLGNKISTIKDPEDYARENNLNRTNRYKNNTDEASSEQDN